MRGRDSQVVKLKAFHKFDNTTEALAAATSIGDSKLSKGQPLKLYYAVVPLDRVTMWRSYGASRAGLCLRRPEEVH